MMVKEFQKFAGFCTISLGLIYITAFIFYGGILDNPSSNASDIEKINFLSENYLMLSAINFIGYILFGILLAVVVVTTYKLMKEDLPNFSMLTSAFGIIWVGLVIASGMIANIGLSSVIEIGIDNPANAMSVWSSITIVSEGLGGGNEIVGGIWVLLLSVSALKTPILSKPLNLLGLFVGTAGILTVFPLDILKEVFGISQIAWFIGLGIAMLRMQQKTVG